MQLRHRVTASIRVSGAEHLIPLAPISIYRHPFTSQLPRQHVCFFDIIHSRSRFGPAARERSFCCLSQCGRYSAKSRYLLVPKFIQIWKEATGDPETQQWCAQALRDSVQGVNNSSWQEWEQWWRLH